MPTPTLYIFSGLPGSGKSTLAQALAKYTGAIYLRIDTVEQALRDLCQFKVEGEGYRLSYRIARDNLKLGLSVIADSCNPIQLTHEEWQVIAEQTGADYVNIEVRCSNKQEHQQRVETRSSSIQNLVLPSWQQVIERRYEPWQQMVISIDTANQSVAESTTALFQQLNILR